MESSSQPLGFCQRLMNIIMCKMSRPMPQNPDSEVSVEFRHADASQKSTQTDEPTIVEKGPENESSSVRKTEAQGKRSKKYVTIRESVGEGEKHKKNQGTVLVHHESHEDTKLKAPRHWRPLLTVESHINEKSEDFIDRKIKAMRRNFSLDKEKS